MLHLYVKDLFPIIKQGDVCMHALQHVICPTNYHRHTRTYTHTRNHTRTMLVF
eukprot:m.337156 g.337156  ORF g.337156 m.337156 type:complete len:53 (+) comp16079_c3_seq13:1057-1215(+)